MSAPDVTPNRRGLRSRESVLDAAERVMAEHGFDSATSAQIVKASGIPASSVYHYFGSKQGILLAVMERGARRFFDELPGQPERAGTPREHLQALTNGLIGSLERHPDFLRLVVVMATQPSPAGEAADAQEVVGRVRSEALGRLRKQMALAFDIPSRSAAADRLARFALAAVDGAFIAQQSDAKVRLGRILEHLPDALVALHTALTSETG